MNFEKPAVGTEGFCCHGHHWHILPVATGLAASSAGSLHAVGAVHDYGGHYVEHVGDVSEVNDEIVVSVDIATLGEPYVRGTAVLGSST